MFAALRRRGLLWPTLLALPALAVLLSLGTWQMQRKAWKERILGAIAERAQGATIPLADAIARRAAGADTEYQRVRLTGRFLHGGERHLYTVLSGQAGYLVYAPMRTEGGAIVLVNRGFVPERLKEPASRGQGQVGGEQTVTGLVRLPGEPSWATPPSEHARNIYFWPDLAGMTLAVRAVPEIGRDAPIVPFFIDAEAQPANPGGWPRGGTTNLALPNRHLEYALTWYGLAATLIGVWLAFVLSRWRATGPDDPAT